MLCNWESVRGNDLREVKPLWICGAPPIELPVEKMLSSCLWIRHFQLTHGYLLLHTHQPICTTHTDPLTFHCILTDCQNWHIISLLFPSRRFLCCNWRWTISFNCFFKVWYVFLNMYDIRGTLTYAITYRMLICYFLFL